MTQYNFTISLDIAGERVDKVLSKLCPDTSRSQIQKAIKGNSLKINDVIISDFSSRVKENDRLQITIKETAPEHILPKNIPLDIIYEDDELIVVNKPVGMNVHPAAGDHIDTLVNALLFHTNHLSDVGGAIRPGIVHRLDKDTSGLMVVAKNNKAHANLANQIQTRSLKRRYKALVFGIMKPLAGMIDKPIGRSKLDRKKMSVLRSGGKEAITHYETIEILQDGLFSLVECALETGRTHQIRVHLSHAGHSIVGDQTYGNNKRKIQGCPDFLQKALLNISHQLLHSFYISFVHPTTEEVMEFEKDFPVDYTEFINFIRNNNKNA